MTVDTIFGRELAELVARPFALAVKLVYPLIVAVPLLMSTAPPFYAAMALTMLAAMLGGLGTAAVLARERASGLQLRYRVLPEPASMLVLKRISTAAAIDFAQLLPVLALIALRHPAEREWWLPVVVTLGATLLAVDVLGAFASTFAHSAGDVMLYVLIPLLPAFYISGLFVPITGLLTFPSLLLPFTYLHASLEGALGGATTITPASAVIAGLAFLVLASGFAVVSGRRVLEAE